MSLSILYNQYSKIKIIIIYVYERNKRDMEILKVENLTKIYGKDQNQVVALNNVSFSVNKGEFVAIVGASRKW